MWYIVDPKLVILYSSIFYLIFSFGSVSFNEAFAQEQEFDGNITVILPSGSSTDTISTNSTSTDTISTNSTSTDDLALEPQ